MPEARSVKDLLTESETLLQEIATLENRDYPVLTDGVETTESALERAKSIADYLCSNTFYSLYEVLGIDSEVE